MGQATMMTREGGPSARRVLRSCIGCRTVADKASLFRVVRTPAGAIVGDGGGKLPGRGAYVCSRACYERAVQSRRFGRALRSPVKESELDAIADAVALWEKSQNRE